MIHLLVVFKVPDSGKTQAAVAALEKAALSMSQQVLLQAAGLRKTLPTLLAVIASPPLRTVVSEFVKRRGKVVPAFDAEVRGVLTFPESVSGEQRGCSERSAALGAVVGVEAAVDSLMLHQDRVMLEAFAAL